MGLKDQAAATGMGQSGLGPSTLDTTGCFSDQKVLAILFQHMLNLEA